MRVSEEGKKAEHCKSLPVESCEVDYSPTMYGGRVTLARESDGRLHEADVV